jgi:hypothetical protein
MLERSSNVKYKDSISNTNQINGLITYLKLLVFYYKLWPVYLKLKEADGSQTEI